MDKKVYDIIIIGAGTAGLSSAIYGKRAGKNVLVLEGKSYGGQIIVSPEVENYPGIKHTSGFEFATRLYEQAKSLDTEILMEEVVNIEADGNYKKVITRGNEFISKAVIIASGVGKRKLHVENEDRFTGAGVSYCATCDGMFYKGMDVLVAGGGNTALEDAKYLSEICKTVYIVHRRDTFRAEASLIKEVEAKDNIKTLLNHNVISLSGDDVLESVKIADTVNGKESDIEVQGLFVAIGQEPQRDIYENVVKTDGNGYIVAGEDCRTNVEGIYAAGDCRTKEVRQLITAAADGAVAAVMACKEM
ncbi:MAG: thioredoxin-disulfide reductase [Clostridiales bacterium]|nr:thioredoxin-disulfide reductase [Clostridiales bacterium]MDD6293400.1 thioredoxin-disulfide reductase [Eubacteriales bacterium]